LLARECKRLLLLLLPSSLSLFVLQPLPFAGLPPLLFGLPVLLFPS
jgi:hypothetical protein